MNFFLYLIGLVVILPVFFLSIINIYLLRDQIFQKGIGFTLSLKY